MRKNVLMAIMVFSILMIASPIAGITGYSNRAGDAITEEKQSSFPDTYDLLIISPEKFSDALQPLVEHKESHGIKTILETTESIYQSSNGRDEAE
ncbi:MAG TPA: hypothetical protein ENL29_00060, partial [Thermoplasmatales archaeon]|nr:hypothetical protein [Thermoplasmatales archaeon]